MFNNFPISFNFDGKQYSGEIKPQLTGVQNGMPVSYQVFFNSFFYGTVRRSGTSWETDSPKCAFMLDVISSHIYDFYQ